MRACGESKTIMGMRHAEAINCFPNPPLLDYRHLSKENVLGFKRQRQASRSRPLSKKRWSIQSNSSDGSAELKQAELQELEEAFKGVDKALKDAEAGLETLSNLPSSEFPREENQLLRAGKAAGKAALLLGICFATHCFGWSVRLPGGLLAGVALGLMGYRKGSLSPSGAVSAAVVGACTFAAGFRATLVLLTFYFTSSKMTAYCEERKSDDEDFKAGGQRNWKQVFCNAFVPTTVALACLGVSGGLDLPLVSSFSNSRMRKYVALSGAFLGYYACCCGDTWASELGQLSNDTPILITSFRPVRKGTNGGVTKLGLLASALGGLCMGLTFYLASLISPSIVKDPVIRRSAVQQLLVIPLGMAIGFAGSLVDSFLGATVQFTGYNRRTQKITSKLNDDVTPISGFPLLDNNAVNLVSASCMAVLTAVLSLRVLVPIEILV